MKIIIFALIIGSFFGCAHISQKGSLQFGGGSYSKSVTASVKIGKVSDSLRVGYCGERFTIAIPYSEKNFSVVCKTTEDIILKSTDNYFLIFTLKTKNWSQLKYGPQKDCP